MNALTLLKPAVLLGLSFTLTAAPQPSPNPLPQAHAHNDYEHTRPLLDALDQGFCSVEADVWLVDGKLLVSHDLRDARPDHTLERLYLNPLRDRIRLHGGRVYPNGPSVTLLIDAKSEATNTHRAITAALAGYRSILTTFRAGRTETNAVTVIISGNRARALMEAEPERWAGYDGRLADLESLERKPQPALIPLVSDNWRLHFTWKGTDGPLPDDERAKLRALVERTHRAGARIRFWGMPDSPVVWKTLAEAGVDLINTDQLADLAEFLQSRPR